MTCVCSCIQLRPKYLKVWIRSCCRWQAGVICVGICHCMCYIQLLLQLILFGWVLGHAFSAENKILSLTTACLCKADPCLYSCLRCRFQLFRNFESAVLSWCLKPYDFCSFRGCSSLWLQAHTTGWRHAYMVWIWPLDFVLNSFLQSSVSESFEMSILLF